MKIRFGEEHPRLFSAASLDFNPLHLSEIYARRTPFGERVVYGVLGFAACLSQIPSPDGRTVSAVSLDFKSALFLDVDYTLRVKLDASGDVKAYLSDGGTTVMRIHLQFREGTPPSVEFPESPSAPRNHARQLPEAELTPGLTLHGDYFPGRTAYLELIELLGIDRRRWGDTLLVTVLCSSYLAGMEAPGESAAYVGLRAEILSAPPEPPSPFEMTLDDYDPRFGLLTSRFSLGDSSAPYARGEIRAIARPPIAAKWTAGLGSGRFAGKTALVIGASRGLGAALALELATEACTVVGVYACSAGDANRVAEAGHNLPGRLIMEQGDPADLDWCVSLKDRIRAESGRLDLLVCNAAPAIQPLRVEEACYSRIQTYLNKGFALVSAPLSGFLGLISESKGGVLLISSEAVEKPPASWPHYVALKAAAEGLVRAAAADHPKVAFWIARPGRMRTSMTNTPLGWLEAEEPQDAARRILEQVASNATPGTMHYCG